LDPIHQVTSKAGNFLTKEYYDMPVEHMLVLMHGTAVEMSVADKGGSSTTHPTLRDLVLSTEYSQSTAADRQRLRQNFPDPWGFHG
jgi:hypothetical protein